MKIKYFEETDTALLEFSDGMVDETREINENTYVDLDASGNLVSMTIEHAKRYRSFLEVDIEKVGLGAA